MTEAICATSRFSSLPPSKYRSNAIVDSMSQSSSDTHGTVFKYWMSAHSQLDHAIREYVDACTALETALVSLPREQTSQRVQNQTFVGLGLELPSLPRHEQKLQEARLRLTSACNSSRALAPINSLPLEILAMIFALATRDWVNEDYQHVGLDETSSATDISGVCRLWRRVMLQSHTFWSELELVLTGPSTNAYYERAALWAERSHTALLDVTVREGEVAPGRVPHPWDDSEISSVLEFLTPLMPRVRALRIHSQEHPSDKLVRALLACWVQHGCIGTAKELEICIDLDLPELALPGISSNAADKSFRPRDLKTFLNSLQNIYLENVVVNWGHAIYSGLTEIWIEFAFQSSWYPTQHEIANLLAANPRLRSLILYSIRIRRQRKSAPAPVTLNHLEVLGLETMDAKDIGLVLPLISSTSNAIRMSLSLDDDPEYISAARSFFTRTNVTFLHADGGLPNTFPTISALFAYMPHLQTLVIQVCDISEDVLRELIHRRASVNKSLDFWPKLHQLHVLQCNATPQILRQLVDIHAPRKLWLYEDLDRSDEWSTFQARKAMREELSRRGVGLVWHLDHEYEPASWTFVFS